MDMSANSVLNYWLMYAGVHFNHMDMFLLSDSKKLPCQCKSKSQDLVVGNTGKTQPLWVDTCLLLLSFFNRNS